MHEIGLALQGGWKVLTAGLLFGAGLPLVYALAMRALAIGATTTTDEAGHTVVRQSSQGRVLMGLLMLVIIAAVLVGIMLIVASGMGKTVSFEHIIPTLVEKTK